MISRRAVLVALAASALTRSAVGAERQSGRLRIGILGLSRDSAESTRNLSHELRALGWYEGKNIVIDSRFRVDRFEQLPEAAGNLVREQVDLILANGASASRAAARATRSIPVVIRTSIDPVAARLVASLGRPGGNVTGVTFVSTHVNGKRLEVLRDAIPSLRRVGVLFSAGSVAEADSFRTFEEAARRFHLQVHGLLVENADAIGPVIVNARGAGVDAIAMVPSSFLTRYRDQIIAAVAQARLPATYPFESFSTAGGLLSYGPNISESWRQVAQQIDKILKGAKPAELPIEQPTKFDLIVNLRTAKALALAIPQTVLLRADKVIE